MRGKEHPRAALPAVRAAKAPWPTCYVCGGPILFDGGAPTADDLRTLREREAKGHALCCWACTLEWLSVVATPLPAAPKP